MNEKFQSLGKLLEELPGFPIRRYLHWNLGTELTRNQQEKKYLELEETLKRKW